MNFADSMAAAQSAYDGACPPDNRRADPEQLARRANEVLDYWNSTDGYWHFGLALGELADNDDTCDPLYELFLAGNVTELGKQLVCLIGDVLQAKAEKYAQNEFDGKLEPYQLLRRVP